MGYGGHTLSEIDAEARTAQCSTCGETTISVRGKGRWRCAVQNRENVKRWAAVNQIKSRERTWRRWGITSASSAKPLLWVEWEKKLQAQDFCCAICKRAAEDLVADHDHGTGRFRGALCGNCNRGIGYYERELRDGQRPWPNSRWHRYLERHRKG